MAANKKPTLRAVAAQLAALTETVGALITKVDAIVTLTANAQRARIAEMAGQVAALTATMEGTADALEMELGVRSAEHVEATHQLYALPTPYHEQAANTASTELERELAEAEQEMESADSWVTRERASQRVEALKRQLHYASFERPRSSAEVIAIDRAKAGDQQFVEPDTSAQTREEAEKRAVKFEKKTR
jgi:hypothetical protein